MLYALPPQMPRIWRDLRCASICPYAYSSSDLLFFGAHLVFGAELSEDLVHAEKLIEGIIEDKT